MFIQPTFYVPPHIASGLTSGELIRYGGVVRNQAGEIVTHLKDAPAPQRQVEQAAKGTAAGVSKIVGPAGQVVGMLLAQGAFSMGIRWYRRRQGRTVSRQFDSSLETYMRAIQDGRLDVKTIDDLIMNLDAVVAFAEKNRTTLEISAAHLNALKQVLVEYTRSLAEANKAELDEPDQVSDGAEGNVVVDIRHHLKAQKRIFEQAA